MILFRQKRQLIALWSCVVVLFSALAPAISQTLATHGNPMMVACSMMNSAFSGNQHKASKYMPLSLKTAAAPSDYSQHQNTASHAHISSHPDSHSSSHHHAQPAMLAALDKDLDAKLKTTDGHAHESSHEHDDFAHEKSEHEKSGHGMVHCPYCNLMHHSPVFLTGNALQILSGNLSYEMPALYYHAPRPLFVWAATQPRGPPTLS